MPSHGSVILPTVNRLLDLLTGRDQAVPLDQAALELQIDSPRVAFLRKPYDVDTLIDALHKVIVEPEQVTE